ncbi:hypothetical protein VP01_515g11 [Puccinia sorghi]|uniref:Uncharacterized protein n=1 Tax=Puccinia sorghi TaxID=27349 RepID=A0A0L6UMW3_9BASI|nr:hypothetical protein VP01_515g11 [Puccinia sorghi]
MWLRLHALSPTIISTRESTTNKEKKIPKIVSSSGISISENKQALHSTSRLVVDMPYCRHADELPKLSLLKFSLFFS